MKKAVFTTGSVNKHILDLAFPALITILTGISFITVDTYFVSKLGQTPLTAISFVFPVVSFFLMIGVGLGIAGSSVLSRLLGAKQEDEVAINIVTLILLSFLLTVILTPVIALACKPIFRLMGASPATMPYIMEFMHNWLPGIFFLLSGYTSSNVLRTHGKAKLSATIQIFSSILNLILSPLFIFGFKLGIGGSALAGVIARIAMNVFTYSYIFKNYVPNAKEVFKRAIKSFWQHSKQLVSIAVPAILTNVIGPIASLWMVHLLAHIGGGGTTVAGFGIASRIEMMAVVPLYAISASVGPVIGQNLGAKLPHRSYKTLISSYYASIIWGVFAAIALYFVGGHIAKIFTQNANSIHVAGVYLATLPCSYAAWGIIMMSSANFNSIGQPVKSTLITFFRIIILFIPLSLILGYKFNYQGIFAAFAIANVIAAACAAVVAIYNWKKTDEDNYNLSTATISSSRN